MSRADKIMKTWEKAKEKLIPYIESRYPNYSIHIKVAVAQEDWERVGELCQHVWELLPDNVGIRTEGFNELCDVAEEWCFGADDE